MTNPIPRPESSDDELSDEDLLSLVIRVAENLDASQTTLEGLHTGTTLSITDLKQNMMCAAVAQAYSAQAQSLSLYLLIASGLAER